MNAGGSLRSLTTSHDGLGPRAGEFQPPLSSHGTLTIQSSLERAQRQHAVPQTYQLRGRPDRDQLTEQKGGSADTEAAVRAALAWLARNQESSGRWDAAKHGAVWERTLQGGDMEGAGMRADTGVTGLALLAFLGAGNTHEEGRYRKTVRRGLEYLLKTQAEDGNLSGQATTPAAMYCHGMATLAIAEAFGMTGDAQLRSPLERAIAYTLAAQSPHHGGWRYRVNDRWGDTSQLGWQLMALKAAEHAGLEIPVACRHGMLRFLDSVSSGRHGGLASYGVGRGVSHVMTAEALYCRLLLGTAPDNLLCDEAARMILANLPGPDAKHNFYYWYYATLATYQLQGAYWETWNRAVQKQLLSLQRFDGSWDPDPIWGGHGGRVYSTALGALCLEVYYRYLPTAVAARAGARRTR